MTSGPGVRSGEEIQGALRRFVERWKDYSGTERSRRRHRATDKMSATFSQSPSDFYWDL